MSTNPALKIAIAAAHLRDAFTSAGLKPPVVGVEDKRALLEVQQLFEKYIGPVARPVDSETGSILAAGLQIIVEGTAKKGELEAAFEAGAADQRERVTEAALRLKDLLGL